MLDNKKTTDIVKEELENDLFLLEILKEDLVNYSALSRALLPKVQKKNPKANIESISIAIKRYIIKEKKQRVSKTIQKIIANSQLSTKNDIIHMTFKRNEAVLNKIMELSKSIKWDQEEIFFVNQGFGEVTIILDKKNQDLLKNLNKDMIEKVTDLAIMSIKETYQEGLEKSINVPGVYSYFITQLSRRSINILEIISTSSQLTLVLKNKDLMGSYEIIDSNIRFLRRS